MQVIDRLLSWFSSRGRSWDGTVVSAEFQSSSALKRVASYLNDGWKVGVLYLDVVHFHHFEQVHGTKVSERILHHVGEALEAVTPGVVGQYTLITIQHLWGDDFVVYVANREPMSIGALLGASAHLQTAVERHLNAIQIVSSRGGLRTRVGAALLEGSPSDAAVGSLVYRAAKQALALAKGELSLSELEDQTEFHRLITDGGLHSVYQPILDLKSGTVFGWEALMRGPVGSKFQSPAALITHAETHSQVWALERAARNSAIAGFDVKDSAVRLFVNVNPHAMTDPEFTAGQTATLIHSNGLRPENVVIEITERTSIEDYDAFRRLIQHYREQGYLIAVDDVGAGYAGLQSISELRPDLLKVDMSLVQGCSQDLVKQAMVEAIVSLALKIGCKVVAEGIESQDDLLVLARLGVHYGQGYLIARPAALPPGADPLVTDLLSEFRRTSGQEMARAFDVAELLQTTPTVPPSTPVREVASLLTAGESLEGVVVVDGGIPVGLVMQSRLFRRLGVPYGVPLFYEKPIGELMDAHPLMIERSTPIAQAARIAAHRVMGRRYDLMVVVDQGRYVGTVSVNHVLNALADSRFREARHANPLTGLPGNPVIHDLLLQRQRSANPFSVLYIDLDCFKIYNDVYGFQKGDRILVFISRLLQRAIVKHGSANDFLGHIGGDDFLVITTPDRVEAMTQTLIQGFDRAASRFYSEQDRTRGGLAGHDREGRPVFAPIMGVSIAVVDCGGATLPWGELGKRAAALKREAKRTGGSRMVRGDL